MDTPPATEISIRDAVDFIPEGLAVYDADLRLMACNRRYRELLDLPERLCTSGGVAIWAPAMPCSLRRSAWKCSQTPPAL